MNTFSPDLLDRLNSMTKYPSIETYHAMDARGQIMDERPVNNFGAEPYWVTEKLDGTNGRIIVLPDTGDHRDWVYVVHQAWVNAHADHVGLDAGATWSDYLIGSRQEFLTARGDRIPNQNLHIVEALEPFAATCLRAAQVRAVVAQQAIVFYFEVYGADIGGAAKQYATKGGRGARLFDVALCPLHVVAKPKAEIATWRESGGQQFLTMEQVRSICHISEEWGQDDLRPLRSVPVLKDAALDQDKRLPWTPVETKAWLEQYQLGTAHLDAEHGIGGKSEGVIVRTSTRAKIAKIRFDDYRKVK